MRTNMVLSVFLVLAIASLSAASEPSSNASKVSFINFMTTNTFDTSQEDTAKCFDHFLPILEAIANEYSVSFKRCSLIEEQTMKDLNVEAFSNRLQVELPADGVCVQMDACNNCYDALDYLDCFSSQGRKNIRTLYAVTQKSILLGGDLQEAFRVVRFDKERCQNVSEQAYAKDSAAMYYELNLCLKASKDLNSTTTPLWTSTTSATNENPTTESSSTTEAEQ